MTNAVRILSAVLVLAVCSFGISDLGANPQVGRVYTYYGCDGTYIGYWANNCGSISYSGGQYGMFRSIEYYNCDTLDPAGYDWEAYVWQSDSWVPSDPPNFPETCP